MLPVVAGLATVGQPFVAGHQHISGDDINPRRIQPRAHHLPRQFARHRVAVAVDAHQAGAGHPRRLLDIAVERLGHRLAVLRADEDQA